MARKRRTTKSRTRTTYSTYRRRRRTSRPSTSLDLGPRPILTIAAGIGIFACVGFLIYALLGRNTWSEETQAVVPIKLALQFAFGLFVVAAGIYLGLQFGWFESAPERTPRRPRRTSTSKRRSTSSTRRRTYR